VINLDVPEAEVRRRTEEFCLGKRGFKAIEEWRAEVARTIEGAARAQDLGTHGNSMQYRLLGAKQDAPARVQRFNSTRILCLICEIHLLSISATHKMSWIDFRGEKKEAGMRIYTVTCDGAPAAVVRADNPADAIDTARELAAPIVLRGHLDAREPNDSEMVSWLEHREDHVLASFASVAA